MAKVPLKGSVEQGSSVEGDLTVLADRALAYAVTGVALTVSLGVAGVTASLYGLWEAVAAFAGALAISLAAMWTGTRLLRKAVYRILSGMGTKSGTN